MNFAQNTVVDAGFPMQISHHQKPAIPLRPSREWRVDQDAGFTGIVPIFWEGLEIPATDKLGDRIGGVEGLGMGVGAAPIAERDGHTSAHCHLVRRIRSIKA